jgi:ATP-dependent Clp protease, protease subunit
MEETMNLDDDGNGKKKRVDELIDEKNLENREVFLWGSVDDEAAEKIVKRLLYLDALNQEDIKLFVNSPGGVISSGLAIVDTMDMVKSDVSTICLGQAASMGAVILALGRKEKRYILPNARVMIHQPLVSGQIFGPASDIQIQADEILRIRTTLNELFAKATKKKLKVIEEDTDRDFFMTANEAIDYGLVDQLWKPS